MILTYPDSGVLIAAWRYRERTNDPARELLYSDERRLVGSRLQRMETILRTRGLLVTAEKAYYANIFDALVSVWATLDESVAFEAERMISRYGLSVPDALHIALALRAGADEFLTTEGTGKPMHRVTELRVVRLPPEP